MTLSREVTPHITEREQILRVRFGLKKREKDNYIIWRLCKGCKHNL